MRQIFEARQRGNKLGRWVNETLKKAEKEECSDLRYRNRPREKASGQFGFVHNWGRVCVCGHELGVHGGEAPHECFNEDRNNMPKFEGALADVPAEPCDCRRFRPSRRRGIPQ